MMAGLPASAPPPGPVLRDIHLPPAPHWWPPAPGWWVLAALLVLAVAGVALAWRHRRRRRRREASVLAELDALVARHARDGDDAALAAGLHALLRRAARQLDPAAAQARGEAWCVLLAEVPVDAATLATLQALDRAIYQPQPLDRAAAVDATRRWLVRALRRRTKAVAHA